MKTKLLIINREILIAMKNKYKLKIVFSFFLFSFYNLNLAQIPNRIGHWKFDDKTNITKADIGKDIILNGKLDIIDGPGDNNFAVKIGIGSYLKIQHNISPSPNNYVNQYTIAIDFRVPSVGKWYCFFQTSPTNNNDGDCFINTSGNIGVAATGYSSYAIKPNEWYRLVISVKNGSQYKYYLDGQLLLNGTVQSVDGRFALDKEILMFADEDGEDNEIDCSEISIWDSPLNNYEVQALGGYGHNIGKVTTQQLIIVPYLQNPSTNSIYVCWHDTLSNITKVEYGTTNLLGQTENGNNEIVAENYRWHTVKLSNLKPNQEYFYKIKSGSGESKIYTFKTLPDENYNGKIRFLLLSDTHSSDTTMAVKVIKEAKKNIEKLFGNDIHNQINAVLHSGDLVVSGSTISQWTDQYFAVMSPISPSIPFLTVTGNHEGEHLNYYKYMHYDEISGYPPPNAFAEKFWSTIIGNTMIIGLNTNLTGSGYALQNLWLESKLREAESNSKIDFVFLIGHHFSITELWGEGITYDAGPSYVTNQLFPILKKYSKVIQYSYGHTHGFERGTVESNTTNHDFRQVCGGGGGGATDRWGAYKNTDFQSIHITHDQYFYQLIEIDIKEKIFTSKMYSLGNSNNTRNNELMDSWYIKLNQKAPALPIANNPTFTEKYFITNTSKISNDSLMTVHIQISEYSDFIKSTIDTMVHWKNIYKTDANYNPIDLNKGIDLTNITIPRQKLKSNSQYFYRVRYRDHNLKWSDWSNSVQFNTPTKVNNKEIPTSIELNQNFPNPFNPQTTISYQLPFSSKVTLKFYNMLGEEISTLVNEMQPAGYHSIFFDGSNLPTGVYYYKMQVGNFVKAKKCILLK